MGRTELSPREVRRQDVLERVARKAWTLREAASVLGVSYAQAKCLRQRYQQGGAAALRHGNAGKRSSRAKPEQLRERVLSLVRSEYGGGQRDGLGPPLAAEHLQSDHGLVVGVSTLRARGSTPLLLLPLPASEWLIFIRRKKWLIFICLRQFSRAMHAVQSNPVNLSSGPRLRSGPRFAGGQRLQRPAKE